MGRQVNDRDATILLLHNKHCGVDHSHQDAAHTLEGCHIHVCVSYCYDVLTSGVQEVAERAYQMGLSSGKAIRAKDEVDSIVEWLYGLHEDVYNQATADEAFHAGQLADQIQEGAHLKKKECECGFDREDVG